jgi:exportin-7
MFFCSPFFPLHHSPTVKAEMVTYFTCYLESHAVGMEPFVAASLTQLLARVVKAGWAEGGAARGAPGALVDLLARARRSGDRAAYGASLRALTALVTEFNTPTPGRTLTAHRKAAVAFRDAALLPAFSAALAEARRLAAPAAARAVAAGIVPPPGVGPPPPSEGDAPCEGGGAFTPAWAATAANPGAPSDARLLEAAVSLALACLSFDFVGTCLDESADDLGTVQAPAAWRGPVSDPATVALFFQVYASAAPPLAPSALECLVRLASVRRSLFASDAERGRFLAALVGGTRGILTGRVGLDAHASYHELCRLLGRLKTNYQLSELVASPGYPDWVARVADFTISSLAAPAWSGGSVFYLLGLWSRLVSSVPYLKAEAPALLDAHVPGVVRAFICSRLGPGGSGRGFTSGSGDGGGRPGSAAAHASGDGGGGGTTPRSNGVNGGGTGKDDEEEDDDDDLLDAAGGMDGGGLADQMDALPHLCRYRYTETASLLAALFDPLAAEFAARVAAAGGGGGPASAPGTPAVSADGATLSASALENRLAWLVHIISTVIKGRLLSSSAAEATEAVDGDLAARVWALSRSAAAPAAAAARARAHSRARLELALLSFCQAFRKVYVGEQTVPAGKVYARLGPAVGLTDARGVLEAMVGKVGSNLAAFGGTAPAVVDATLALFGDLASGYSSGKTLLTLDATRYLLTADPAFAFPALLAAPGAGRARTALHSTLARLLFMDPASPVAFRTFMTPLERALTAIAAAAARAGVVEVGGNGAAQPPALASAPIAVPDPAALRASVPAPALAGILRDLRGIAASTNSRRTFALLFDWLYPAHVRALGAALAAWAPDPAACTPALKLWAELALNKAQRLAFEPSSPNGILLFREVSRAVVTYGAAALAAGPPLPGTGDPYVSRYKPTSAALAALTRALAGGYANFGVFALYGDPALVDALRAGLGLALAIPLPDVVAHKKVAKAVFGFLETLASSQPSALAEADTPTFAAVVEALDAGLRSLDVAASSQCAAAVDALVAFYLRGCAAAAAAGAGGEDGGMNGHHLHRPPTTPTGAHLPLPLPLEEGGGDAACGLSAAAAARAIAAHLAARPDLFPRLLASLLEVALFEDCPNQWSLSRPMLALILVVGEGVAGELADRALVAHAPDRRGALAAALGRLMAGVSRSLEPRNRDRFTQNLTLVRHEFKAKT